jgi:hypothetical protein
MNLLTQNRMAFQRWRRRRLQQYADRSGLSLTQVLVLLENPPSHRSFRVIAADIDRKVDPLYQLSNMPVI